MSNRGYSDSDNSPQNIRPLLVVVFAVVLAVGGMWWWAYTPAPTIPADYEPPDPPEITDIRYSAEWSVNVDMPFVKFDNNRLSTVTSFDLELKNLDDFVGGGAPDWPNLLPSVSATLGGASCSIGYYNAAQYLWDGSSWTRTDPAGSGGWLDTADAFADAHDGLVMGDILFVAVYSITSSVSGGGSDTEYWATGSHDTGPTWAGPTSNSWSGTLKVNNAVAKFEVTDASSTWRESPRSFRDRSAEGKWYADGQTTYTATLGDTSASGDAAWSDEDIPLNGYPARVQFGINYEDTPELDTSYAEVNNITFSVAEVAADDLDAVNFYSDDARPSSATSDYWTYAARNPGGQIWRAFGEGNALRLHRIGGSSNAASWGLDVRPKGPIRVNIDAGRFGKWS